MLDTYVEQIYSGIEEATQGTYMVLQLARTPANLEKMLENETLVDRLLRLLRDEAKWCMDVAINIMRPSESLAD